MAEEREVTGPRGEAPAALPPPATLSIIGGALGIVLFLTGMGLAVYTGKVLTWYVPPLFILGPVLIVTVLLWSRGQQERSAFLRRAMYGANIFLACALLAVTLLMANFLVYQYGPKHFDWTSEGVFSLSSQTKNLLAKLEKPVQFHVMYQRASGFRSLVEQTLDLYLTESSFVKPEYVDPLEDQLRSTELYNRYPDAKTGEPVVIVTFGEGERPEHQIVKHDDIFRATARRVNLFEAEPEKTEFRAEDAFSSAINRLMEARKTKLYFTTGHGERDLENSREDAASGLGLLKERLQGMNLQVEAINVLEQEVPKDCGILVIAGPKTPFLGTEIPKLRTYMAGGGRMIVLLDPGFQMTGEGKQGTGLEELLAEYQVTVGDDLVLELQLAYRSEADFLALVSSRGSSNPIASELVGQTVLLTLARRVQPAEAEGSSPPGRPPTGPYRGETLLTSTRASWADTDYRESRGRARKGPGDVDGPVSLAVAVSQQESDPASAIPGHPPTPGNRIGRLVVVGDADFVSNPALRVAANEAFFTNAVNWLRGRLELLGIPPKEKKALRLTLSSAEFNRLVYFPIAVVLLFVVTTGITVWRVRRRI